MTQDEKGGGAGVWNGPKKDDVIYEKPLILNYINHTNYFIDQVLIQSIFTSVVLLQNEQIFANLFVFAMFFRGDSLSRIHVFPH